MIFRRDLPENECKEQSTIRFARRAKVHPTLERFEQVFGARGTGISANNLLFLELETPVDFSQPCVCPICLFSSAPARLNEDCVLAGTGCSTLDCDRQRPPFPITWIKRKLSLTEEQCETLSPANDERGDTICAQANSVDEVACLRGNQGNGLFCYDRVNRRYYLKGIFKWVLLLEASRETNRCESFPALPRLIEGRIGLEEQEEPYPENSFLIPTGYEPIEKHLSRLQLYAPEMFV